MNKESIYYVLQETDAKERDTLRLLAFGYSNSEIAKELCISVQTVEYRVRKLYKKFDVTNKKELLTNFLDDYIVKILNSPVLK